jgi:nitrate/nitrite transporter NarK
VVSGALASRYGARTYFVVIAIVASIPGLIIMASRKVNSIDEHRREPLNG